MQLIKQLVQEAIDLNTDQPSQQKYIMYLKQELKELEQLERTKAAVIKLLKVGDDL